MLTTPAHSSVNLPDHPCHIGRTRTKYESSRDQRQRDINDTNKAMRAAFYGLRDAKDDCKEVSDEWERQDFYEHVKPHVKPRVKPRVKRAQLDATGIPSKRRKITGKHLGREGLCLL